MAILPNDIVEVNQKLREALDKAQVYITARGHSPGCRSNSFVPEPCNCGYADIHKVIDAARKGADD